jgi:hypothetical protein
MKNPLNDEFASRNNARAQFYSAQASYDLIETMNDFVDRWGLSWIFLHRVVYQRLQELESFPSTSQVRIGWPYKNFSAWPA